MEPALGEVPWSVFGHASQDFFLPVAQILCFGFLPENCREMQGKEKYSNQKTILSLHGLTSSFLSALSRFLQHNELYFEKQFVFQFRAVEGQFESRMENPKRVEIEYCVQCRWMLRAAWLAQELLTTFEKEIGEVALKPGAGGIFAIRVNGETIWDRKEKGRFPEAKEIKQLVRDLIAPGKSLGHSDHKAES